MILYYVNYFKTTYANIGFGNLIFKQKIHFIIITNRLNNS